jgi:hypothetical protein
LLRKADGMREGRNDSRRRFRRSATAWASISGPVTVSAYTHA